MKCLECGGTYSLKRDSYVYQDEYVGDISIEGVPYYQCECGSVLFTEEIAARIEEERKSLINRYLSEYPVKDFLTVAETVVKLGITKQGLHKNKGINRGFIYSTLLGGCKIYLKQSVDQYLRTKDGRFPLFQSESADVKLYVEDTIPLVVETSGVEFDISRYSKKEQIYAH